MIERVDAAAASFYAAKARYIALRDDGWTVSAHRTSDPQSVVFIAWREHDRRS